MTNIDVIYQLLVLGEYMTSLTNNNDSSSVKEKIKALLVNADTSFVMQTLNICLQSLQERFGYVYEDLKEQFAIEMTSLGLSDKIDAYVLMDMMDILFKVRRNYDMAGAVAKYNNVKEQIMASTSLTRALSLTFYRQFLSSLLSGRNMYEYLDEVKDVCERLSTFTYEEIEEYGISAAIMQL